MSVRTAAEFSAQCGAAFNSGSMETLMSQLLLDHPYGGKSARAR